MTTIKIPERLTVETALAWLLEHAPEIAKRLVEAFDDPRPVAEILAGDGASAEELTKRRGSPSEPSGPPV